MTDCNKHIASFVRKTKSSLKCIAMLTVAVCLFLPQSAYGQVLTNEGAAINVVSAVVDGGDLENNSSGTVKNDGTINLQGDYRNNANTMGSGYYNIKGDWVNLGFFVSDNSTVQLVGSTLQNVINPLGDDFYNLKINNNGDYNNGAGSKILLNHSIEVLNTLTLERGIIEYTNRTANRLYLMNRSANSLIYQSGRIVGKFERGINSTANYLFPLGSNEYYNPLNLKPNDITSQGSVLSDFIRPNDLLDTGLPLVDSFAVDTSEIYETFPEGYWSLEANEGFAVADYNIDMDGAGFTNVQPITRVLKQNASTGVWEVDGTHADADGTVSKRENLDDGIPGNGNHYAFGRARPHIKEQPVNFTVCELGTDGNFRVKASGRLWFNNRLQYQWQVSKDNGATWETLDASHPDYDNYQGTDENELLINVAYLYMDQYQYRVIVTDKHENDKISDPAILFVDPLPTAIATPADELLCNDETTEITVTNDLLLPGTTYILEVLNSSTTTITGAFDDVFDGDTVIRQTLTNPGSNADFITYRIVPYGNYRRLCEGWEDIVTIWVNPTPDIELAVPDSVICNEGSTDFAISTPNTQIRGDWFYDLTVTADAGISGARTGGRTNETSFTEELTNNTSIVQKVVYHFHPVIIPDDGGSDCENGGPNDKTIIIWVNPTPDIEISVPNTVACNEATTTIAVTTPNVTLRGDWFYDITVIELEPGISSPDASLDARRIAQGPLDLTLVNNTPHVKSVVFNFHPVIEPDDDGEDCENGVPNDIAVTIFVNPTPELLVLVPLSVTNEQIYCNGDNVTFSLDNNQQTVGTIKYDLEVTGDDALFYGNTNSQTGRAVEDFTDNLIHYQSTISELNYRLIPYIESETGTPTCYRPDNVQNIKIDVVPVLKSSIVAEETVYGGFNITCNGDSDGVIDLEPVGGDYRYNYSIQWKQTDASGDLLQVTDFVREDRLDNLTAGSYYYSITDTLGCFHDSVKVMIEPEAVRVDDALINNPDCVGDGYVGDIILVDVAGGAEADGYSYYWISRGSGLPKGTNRDLIAAAPDEYEVTITDKNNCKGSMRAEITPAQSFSPQVTFRSVYGNYNVRCKGDEDAFVQVRTNGLNEPFSYIWLNEDMDTISSGGFDITFEVESLSAGTYYYQVMDSKGCLAGKTERDALKLVRVTEPDPITFARSDEDLYPGGWDIPCNGDTLGKISLSYIGGHTEYLDNTFAWTQTDGGYGIVPSDSIQTGLTAGTYSVVVTDSFNCKADTTLILEEPDRIRFTDSLRVNDFGPYNITCFNDSDGEIYLRNLRGGGPKGDEGDGAEDYFYKWTSLSGLPLENDTLQNQSGLPAGFYSVRVEDQIGCYVDSIIELTEPQLLTALTDSSLRNNFEISCYNGSDGMISVTPSGGTRDYSYLWNEKGLETDTVVTGLSAGYYSVTITDPNGCASFHEWTLSHPDTITLNQLPTDFIECYGDTSTIHIYPDGGVGGFSYQWDGVSGDNTLNGVEDGFYYVVVEDANGCQVDDSLYIGQNSRIMPEILIRSDYNGEHISCFGRSDAALEIDVYGGNSARYTFEWSIGPQYDNEYYIKGLPAGTYSVQGRDASECPFDTSIVVIDPLKLEINYTSTDPFCNGDTTGVIRIAPRGGTPSLTPPAYNYYFMGKDSLPVAEFSNLPAGIYEVAVTDANRCSDTIDIELVQPDPFHVEFDTVPSECPDESNAELTVTLIEGGTEPYLINGGVGMDFFNLKSGEFILTITDNQNCIYTDTIFIESKFSSCLDITNAFTPNGDGANDFWIIDDDEDGSDMFLYPDAELTIMNRWGEVIYYTNDVANEPWDGNFKGRELPIDSYYYMLNLNNGDPVITGNITIIR